ncbi:MAG: hypothetical protein ACI4BH_08440 [Muribaculaceae bacterium]
MKLRHLLLVVILSVVALSASAWDGGKRHWQIELGVGPTFLANELDGFKNWIGGVLYAEGRYAFSYVPVTVGIYVGRNVFDRRYSYRETDENGVLLSRGTADVNFWSTNYMVTADYYVDIKRNVQFFAGAAVGMCKVEFTKEVEVEPMEFGISIGDKGTSGTAAFVPRIGVVVNNLRLTLGYKLQEKANRAAFFSVGYIFKF